MAALTKKIGRVKLKYRGLYDAGTLYQALDWVSIENGVAFCVVDNTTGVAPTE